MLLDAVADANHSAKRMRLAKLVSVRTCFDVFAQKNQSFLTGFTGADTQIRTGDLILTKDRYRQKYYSTE